MTVTRRHLYTDAVYIAFTTSEETAANRSKEKIRIMIRIITLKKDDGTVIKTEDEEFQTEKNWNKKFFKLKRNATGTEFTWRNSRGRNENKTFYSDKEVLPMTERERERYILSQKALRKEAAERRKANKEIEQKAEELRFARKFGVLMKQGRTIILDSETTGLSSMDEILQLAIIDDNENVLMNNLFKPKKICKWPDAEAVHGIGPDDVADQPCIMEYRDVIQNIINSADIIVAYNANFDLGMLKRYGISIPRKTIVIDTMLLFAEVYGEWSDYFKDYRYQKLSTCASYFGYQWGLTEAHDALADCKATLYCTNCLRELVAPKFEKNFDRS